MEQLSQRLQQVVTETIVDMTTSDWDDSFERHFQLYETQLHPALRRYRHHRDTAIDVSSLRSRYRYETALLHILTAMVCDNLSARNLATVDEWPVFEASSSFSWYQLPDNLQSKVRDLANEIAAVDDLGLALSQLSGQILNQEGRKHLGEYHTPFTLVEHLIAISRFTPADLFHDKRVVDPACGSGIILTAIARKAIAYGRHHKLTSREILSALSKNLYGYDVQPFAVMLTKTLLLYTSLNLLDVGQEGVEPLFENIRLLDPLAATDTFWEHDPGFHFIIGNPPFLPVSHANVDYLPKYAEVVYGHANLYQLFLWWAVWSSNPGGIVSFLVPQSILAGFYFDLLRKRLDQVVDLLSLTRMIDRKGVVGDADLQMMAISFRVAEHEPLRPAITLRVTRNGSDIDQVASLDASYSRVVRRLDNALVWNVSDNQLDYDIAECVEQVCVSLGSLLETFRCGNGEVVWNQHKNLLLSKPKAGAIPLVSAVCIEPYTINFPYRGPHPSHKRPFARLESPIAACKKSGPLLLIQRTTPRKVGRRLIAGILDDAFCDLYPEYFLENHVNYIRVLDTARPHLLNGLAAWLNSDLVNFIFQLRNGTAHVSVSELELLPVNLELLKLISDYPSRILVLTENDQSALVADFNRSIFDWFGLDNGHRERIQAVLSRKERVKGHDSTNR